MIPRCLGAALGLVVAALTACGAQVPGVVVPQLPSAPALPTSTGMLVADPAGAALAAGNAVTSDPFGQVRPPTFQTVTAPTVTAPSATDVQSGVMNQARQVNQ